MDVFEAIARRHSYRGGFTDARVPREHLTRIVQAGIQAPSGCNAQTTSFVIVDDPAVLARLAAIVDKPVVREARAIIVCVVEHRAAYGNMSFAVEDCSAAVENMLLAITALGYATVWLDGVLRTEGKAQAIADVLGVPSCREVRIMLPLGVPKEPGRQRERLPFAARAGFNRYGGGRDEGAAPAATA
jgi:nitroreductase